MKANAPEKIYIINHSDYSDRRILNAFTEKETNNDIEYIRNDAFIYKAANYIKKDMLDNLAFQGRLKRIEIIDGIIEKFIKVMKGE